MGTYHSNLDYLMNTLDISGKEISKHLNIDNSLVSKWKNNKRPLTMHTSHLEKLAGFLVNHKKGIYIDTIKGILSEYYPDKSFSDIEYISNTLMFWLTENYEPVEYKLELSDGENYIVFCGNDGRREAVILFLDEVLKQNSQQNLMLVSQEEMSWLLEDSHFLLEWKEKILKILLKGNTITIIHWVDRSSGTLKDIIGQWLPLYLTGNIKSWYLPRYSDPLIKSTLFLAENTIAITGMEGSNKAQRYTTLFRDKTSLEHYKWVFGNIKNKCHSLVHVFSFPKDNLAFAKEIENLKNIEGECISLSNFPSFYTLPEEMFCELLDRNEIDEKLKGKSLRFYHQIRTLFEHKVFISIYTRDGIKKALNQKTFIYKDLSMMMDLHLLADQDFIKRHLNYLLDTLKSEENQLGYIDGSVELNTFINSEGFAFTWNSEKSNSLVLATEANVVATFYNQLLTIWESTPRINKDPEILKKKFQDLI